MQDMYTVMIVDDEKAIRDSLPAVINFEMYGFRVCQTARNGQDALEKIRQQHPDVLLLDIRMPILDGLGLLKEFRADEGVSSICHYAVGLQRF